MEYAPIYGLPTNVGKTETPGQKDLNPIVVLDSSEEEFLTPYANSIRKKVFQITIISSICNKSNYI